MKNFLDILPRLEPHERKLVLLDDQNTEAEKLDETSKLVTQGSHHRKITVLYIVQNDFENGKVHSTISPNSHFTLLFKNPRDRGQIRSLAQQVLPTQVLFFIDGYREAKKKEHGSILLDLHPLTPDRIRVRSSILKSEELEIYAPSRGL